MSALIRTTLAVKPARVEFGMWVGDCAGCGCATPTPPFTPHFACCGCGFHSELVWPAREMMQGIMRLLMMRPNPATQNWLPHESLHDLMFENGAHGIFDRYQAPAGESLFTVGDTGIVQDRLPVGPTTRALPGKITKAVEAS